VIERALEDFSKEYRMTEFENTASSQLKKIFKTIRDYLEPGQKFVFRLTDVIDPDQGTYEALLTKEKVEIYTPYHYKGVLLVDKETHSWDEYLKLLPLFPSEVKIAVEELKILEKIDNTLWQLIK